ncbi:transaldolase family protein [Carboxylicivirga caseinilyticus]|uniref:transaldolase family protein n=1 Tax=Carboxylicivirga caseinilyticus TaxID=3417572 RepID=UPI003D33FE12|nr:transaldolase [Marinilabiliaceae bacterium A049]
MIHPISSATIHHLADQFNDQPQKVNNSDYWNQYLKTGTNLWLDTGDIEASSKLWNSAFTALTTNNTLLNAEVQKGLYDTIIPELSSKLRYLSDEEKVKEIAFCLNAIHGLRIAKIFNCKVSVELHTDLAHDVNGIETIGKRLFDINPSHFIIKVPFTASGLLGARKLHEMGIPVNFTLDFSVRQNGFAAVIAQPAYTNVFLGRLGAYLKNNNLGDGQYIGEKVTLESQRSLLALANKGISNTRLIAASIRSKDQLYQLLGCDTFTIPVGVATDAVQNLIQISKSDIVINNPTLFDTTDTQAVRLPHLWLVEEHEKEVIHRLNEKTPSTAQELIEYAYERGCHDIFPILTKEEHEFLRSDGKIPVHERWADKIRDGEVGIDSLLNLAGLYSFEKDQADLDNRIKSFL